MKDLLIAVDMDNTLNNFSLHFFKYVNKLGYEYDITKYQSYEMDRAILVPPTMQKEIKDTIFNLDEFWLTIPLLDEATRENFEWLYESYPTVIVTTPFKDTKKFRDTKIAWIKNNLPFVNVKDIIFATEKWEMNIDVIIEDKPDTLYECYKNGMVTVAPSCVYTNGLPYIDHMLYSWRDLKSIMTSIEEKETE
jgi:5'(3')-deoxyribonucleotidase